MRHRWYTLSVTCLLLIYFQLAVVLPVDATKVMRRNIQELVAMGDQIVVGKVVQVRDGIDAQNVPYTEVTIEVRETPKGTASGSYTFRQFGLTKPRDMGNGYTNLNVTPDGWPTYAQGENVVVFLYKEAAWTGLRTTVGLMQGKFTIRDGFIANDVNNEGLFNGVRVNSRSSLNEKEQAMLQMKQGRIPEDVFMSFLRKSTTQDKFFNETGGE